MAHTTPPPSPSSRIGLVAQRTGLSIDTVRFYEKRGLLERPHRTEGGFRLYDEHDVENLCFIRSAQGMGFSLAEIRELLVLRDTELACSHVRTLAGQKLAALRVKLAELRRMERALEKATTDCDASLDSSQDHARDRCPVLQMIAGHRISLPSSPDEEGHAR